MTPNHTLLELKKAGFRITTVRKQLVELLENMTNPITVTEILNQVKANKTTIYREIETLLDQGYLIEVYFNDGVKRYELSNRKHHHHLICDKCKSVSDVSVVDDFSKTEKAVSYQTNFKIMRHSLEFFGLCANCK